VQKVSNTPLQTTAVNKCPFRRAKSGNPAGRRPGEPNKATRLAQEAVVLHTEMTRYLGWMRAQSVEEDEFWLEYKSFEASSEA
jgi:hypothetical protein